MNNTSSNVVKDIANKLPVTLFFEELPDRKQALKYINWLYTNIPESKTIEQDKLFREVISKEFRIVSMKLIEIEILFMVALNKITIEDFTLDSTSLIKKIISENPDKNDLDLMYRILAQIMTKLPIDLREKITGKQKKDIFQSVSKFINMEPKLLERFVSFNPSLNTPISMDLDSGDYNTLNKKYLDELKKFQESQPYVDSNSMQYSDIANKILSSTPTNSNGNSNIKGQYIDYMPDLMTGVNDNKLYYFDSSSGTISEMPISGQNQAPVSMNDLNNILLANKVDKNQIKNLITQLQSSTTTSTTLQSNTLPTTTHPISFLNSIKSYIYGSSSSSSNSIPVNTITNASPLAPIPPQFILSNPNLNPNQGTNYINTNNPNYYSTNPIYNFNQGNNPNYDPNQNKNYNPNDFINPKINSNLYDNLKSDPSLSTSKWNWSNWSWNDPKYSMDWTFSRLLNPDSISPQRTSDFMTRNNACSLPNPPTSCPVKTQMSVGINDILEQRYGRRDSTYNHNPPVTTKASTSPSPSTTKASTSPSTTKASTSPSPSTTQASSSHSTTKASTSPSTTQASSSPSTTQASSSPSTSQASSSPSTTKASTSPSTTHISPFSNMNPSNIEKETEFIKKLTKKNKDIENVAITFVTIIILLFLLVIFNSIRNKNGLTKSK